MMKNEGMKIEHADTKDIDPGGRGPVATMQFVSENCLIIIYRSFDNCVYAKE